MKRTLFAALAAAMLLTAGCSASTQTPNAPPARWTSPDASHYAPPQWQSLPCYRHGQMYPTFDAALRAD